MLNIEQPGNYRIAVHHLGFRPFFLLASLLAAGAMFTWLLYYPAKDFMPNGQMRTLTWHAHEMIFGYGMAVVAGFLLTAVRNWTNVQTLHGTPLMLLAALWLGARIMPFAAWADGLVWQAILDLGFNLGLWLALVHPVVKVRQWKQTGILLLILLAGVANLLFYLSMLQVIYDLAYASMQIGIYLLVMLIMFMGRRVIPFFIEKGLATTTVRNRVWLDHASLGLMGLFILLESGWPGSTLAAVISLSLAALQGIRLVDWYRPALWRHALLWSLYLAFVWLTIAFVLRGLVAFTHLNPLYVSHAFNAGVIGLVTVSMMIRVTLGHTGREVLNPPAISHVILGLVVGSAVLRVFVPMLWPEGLAIGVLLSQVGWLVAFVLFIGRFGLMWIRPRVDGRFG